MMMRRVQTAAAVSGGGEGASDVLDSSDASCVSFVSCNASAILARKLKVLVGSLLSFYEAKLSCWLKGQLRVYATFQPLADRTPRNKCIHSADNTREYCY
jgi:hypothetical protein